MLEVIRQTSPRWIVGENVPGLLSQDGGLVFERVCSDLENAGYEVLPLVLSACSQNAPHRRDRIWVVARNTGLLGSTIHEEQTAGFIQSDQNTSDSESEQAFTPKQRGLYSEFGLSNSGSKQWNEHWYEAATRLCGAFNGLSNFMDRSGGLKKYASFSDKIARQDLPCLWEGFQSETFQWRVGRFDTVQNKENLFAVLWQFFRESCGQNYLSFESEVVQKAYVRNVWEFGSFGCSSQRWEYQEQYFREHSDALSLLSYEVALVTSKIVKEYDFNRAGRLKALGNAIVPQVAAQIFKAIKTVDEGME